MAENIKKKTKANAEKPISLRPLKFDEAVSDLLKVKPDVKKIKQEVSRVEGGKHE
jgi:hypothetical protein